MAPLELLLFGFLLVTGVMIARLRDLFAAAMLTGMFSLLSASLFVLNDAVDVAFTEAAVAQEFRRFCCSALSPSPSTRRSQAQRACFPSRS